MGTIYGILNPPLNSLETVDVSTNFNIPTNYGIAAEDETIDAFDVHPANRWTYTNFNDAIVTDTVSESQYSLEVINGGESEDIFISRPLKTLDSKAEISFNIINQEGNISSEYYESVENDKCDFTEDSEGWAKLLPNQLSFLTGGAFTAKGDNSHDYCGITCSGSGFNCNANTYTTLSFTYWHNFTAWTTIDAYCTESTGQYMKTPWDLESPNTWRTKTFSSLSNWGGTETYFTFQFEDMAHSAITTSQGFRIDNITLTSATTVATVDGNAFQFGLYDEENDYAPLLIKNNFSSLNNVSLEVELTNGIITEASYASDYETMSNDEFFKCEYVFNIVESKLKITWYDFNGDTLNRIEYPDDFTITDYSPTLFTCQRLDVFFGFELDAAKGIHRDIKVDYVKAKFNEKLWTHEDIPTDNEFTQDSPFFSIIDGSCVDTSIWSLDVEYLDAINFNFLNGFQGDFASIDSRYYSEFYLYNVDKSNGNLELCLKLRVSRSEGSGSTETAFQLSNHDGTLIFVDSATTHLNVSAKLQVGVTNERRNIETKLGFMFEGDTNYEITAANISLSNINTNYSHEFVVKFKTDANTDSNAIITNVIEDFSLIQRDIFQDIVNTFGGFVNDVVDGFMNALYTILSPLIYLVVGALRELFNWLGSTFGGLLDTLLSGIISGLNNLLSGIAGLFDDLLAGIGSLIAGLADLLETISEAIGMVAEYVWQQFIDSIDDIIDAIVNTLPSFIDEIIDFFLGLIDGILETIGIKTFVEAVINTLGIVWQTIIDILTGLYNTFNYFLTIAAIFACVAVPAIWLYVGLNAATTTNNVFSFFDKFFQLLASHVAPKFNIQGYAIEVQLYMLLFPATIIVCALAAVYA